MNFSRDSYNTVPSKTRAPSAEETAIGVVILIVLAIVAIATWLVDSSKRRREEEERRRKALIEQELKLKKEEEERARRREELKREEERRRLKRQADQAELERHMAAIDEHLKRENKKINESYSGLYKFQQQALGDMFILEKKFCILPTGAGKTAVMFNWLKYTNIKKVLIVTTASKRDSGDFENEANIWCGAGWKKTLKSFEIISWHGLKNWTHKHSNELDQFVYAFDEVHNASGAMSEMSFAFRRIARYTNNWSGYTATPGDQWRKFAPYFIATGKMRSYTSFESKYAQIQYGKGYKYIIGYAHEPELEAMWRDISTTPDASLVFEELPAETEEVVHFEKPSGYDVIMEKHTSEYGERLDNLMALCHSLRQKCCSRQKLNWIADFIDGLETSAVIFYNYVVEGDRIVEVLKRKLPKEAKIWRIDGGHHEIPTKETIGPRDVVVAQYSSGSNSLNLQFIYHWISFSPNYSYTLSIQAKGRIKRIGQQHAMFFYYFQTDNTIEDAIYKCLFNKQDFSEKVWAADEGLPDNENDEEKPH